MDFGHVRSDRTCRRTSPPGSWIYAESCQSFGERMPLDDGLGRVQHRRMAAEFGRQRAHGSTEAPTHVQHLRPCRSIRRGPTEKRLRKRDLAGALRVRR
jgi:hypothetical protein